MTAANPGLDVLPIIAEAGPGAIGQVKRDVANPPFPATFNARPAPYGVSFTGGACSEPRLIEIGYAFEQATKRRVPPALQ